MESTASWEALLQAGEFSLPGMAETLPYRLYIPAAAKDGLCPLVLFLHGAGERGGDNARHLQVGMLPHYFASGAAEQYPAIIVAPQCPEDRQWVDVSWSEGNYRLDAVQESPYLHLAAALVEMVAARYPVDSDRLYLTGASMGGYGTWDLLLRYPERFAAAIPICGAGDASKAARLRDMPLWVFHGQDDNIVPVSGSRRMVAALWEAGSERVRYTEFYTGVMHGSWDPAYADPATFAWLFAQRRARP